MTPEEFAAHPRVTAAVLSPDGAWIAAAVQRQDAAGGRYVSDLWRVPVDGSAPVQLTDGDTSDRAPCFRADGALGYLSDAQPEDADGDHKHTQVWLLRDGAQSRLTDEPLGVSRFALDGETLVLTVPVLPGIPHTAQRAHAEDQKKNGPSLLRYSTMPVRHWDHWRQPTRTHLVVLDAAGRRDLTPDVDGEFHESQWHVASGKVVITAVEIGTDRLDDTALWVFDLATGTRTVIPARPGINLASPRLSPDGTRIAAARSARLPGAHGPVRLCLYTLDGHETVLAEDWDRWPTPVAWRGAEVIAAVRDQGTTSLYAVSAAGHTPVSLGHSHDGVSVTCGTIVGLQHHLLSPPAPFLLSADGVLRLLPLQPPPALDVVVESQIVTSTDGAAIQGFIVRPRQADGPLPGLLWVHGGPVSHWADWWHWRWNAAIFAAAGYVVALPNPRGSTGFGQDFVEGIWGNAWGGQCVADVLAYADALSEREDVDSTRIGAMGASFGGYMMNWLGGTTDRFSCIVCHAGIYDFRSFYGVTDYPAYWGHQFGCDPYSDPEGHHRYSPIRNLPQWVTPTLIIHGEKDYRCPIDQALGLFEGLQRHGVPAELVVFPDEGHWIMKPRNVVAWHAVCLEYLADQLAPTSPA